jgi:hypothetical protein
MISKAMPRLSADEDARRDAEAECEFVAGKGVPADAAFAWLHGRIDGAKAPMPKARKIS